MLKFNMNLIGNLNKIVAYPDAMIEVKYRIGNRYRIASKVVNTPASHDTLRRSKPRHLQLTPTFKLGNTLKLESKTKVAQPIHACQN